MKINQFWFYLVVNICTLLAADVTLNGEEKLRSESGEVSQASRSSKEVSNCYNLLVDLFIVF